MRLVIMMLTLLVPVTSFAADGTSCAKIDDTGERLLCYDGVFRTETKTEPATASSNWTVHTQTSKIDDSPTVVLMLTSDDDFPGKYGNQRTNAEMTIRCMENRTSAFFQFGDHFMADNGDFGHVTFRIDDKPAFSRSLRESTDHGTLGLWDGGASIPFLKQLMEADQLVVRATPFSESPITTTFTVAGLAAAIKPLRDACKW